LLERRTALVGEEKAARLDDIDAYAETGPQPEQRARVLRDVGFEEGEAHGYTGLKVRSLF
jgi:hypothetical protein